ncbi:MAG: acylneuraminate cytidylyltransferase family protein [Hyphomonadaceae bacterium]|nr:acylneuraminate cytidylyltransferase family protein [Hyphomonadaceae bacterium]
MAIDPASKILALVPARGGSKRIPRKNVIDFHGKPMVAYPIDAALRAGLFGMVHVSSDDDEIRAIAKDRGADPEPVRPAELSDDMTGILPVARWVLQTLTAQGRVFEHVFILFPCAPMITAHDMREAWEVYRAHGGAKNLLTIGRNPVPAEWLYAREADGRLVPRTPGGAFSRSQDLAPAYYETGTFTIFSAKFLLDADNIADDTNYVGYELPAWKAVDIDTPAELEHARALYAVYAERLAAEDA